jgi:periplasmic protein TonB
MRLSLSLLVAALFHGVLLGVGLAVLSHRPDARAVPEAVEIDVAQVEIAEAKPDPIADVSPGSGPPEDSAAPTRAISPVPRQRPERMAHLAPTSAHEIPPALAPVADDLSPAVPAATPPGQTAVVRARSAAPASARATGGTSQSGAGAVPTATPRYRTNPKPDYPIACLRRREEGVVLLNVAVDGGGTPTAIWLNRSSGYPLLDRAALDAVRRWTFEPARSGGVPMFSQVVVPVRFSLEDQP